MKERTRVLFAVDWYDYEINAGIAAYAREAGWVLSDAACYPDMHSRTSQAPPGWSGDGVITLINHPESPVARYVRGLSVPVVDLVDEAREYGLPRVLAHNQAIGAMAAEYLMDIGFENLAFQRLFVARVTETRAEGFRAAVLKAGKRFYDVDFMRAPRGLNPQTDLVPWLAEQLSRIPVPFGLMMQHDGENMITFAACEQAGLSIPTQVAVVGVDNNELTCDLGPIGLSSIDRNRRLHGYKAAALLDRLVRGEAPPTEPILVSPREVVVRESTDALAFGDNEMQRAASFLRNTFRDPEVSVATVVKAMGISRRKLYYLFRKHLGRGVQQEINHLRLAEARHLLATTDMKVFSIAMEAGFTGERHLARVLKAELGVSPRAYREHQAALRLGGIGRTRDGLR